MKTLATTLMLWIAANCGLPMPETIPGIKSRPQEELQASVFCDAVEDGRVRPKVLASYVVAEKTVYLCDDWDITKLRDQSALLHELVHHAQHQSSTTYRCPALMEALAYKLQVSWLKENGVKDPYELLGINPLFVIVVSTCPIHE